jgi:biopolymer transport protein ExbD
MRIRKSVAGTTDKVEMQMTPMIDIVFQLLVFFVMSFKIVEVEGDFNIKMPAAAPSEGPVRLEADNQGRLAGIRLGSKPLTSFQALHLEIRALIGDDRGPGSFAESAEVELDVDYNLKYEYVVHAITAISGYVDEQGNVVKLIEKLKFAPPKKPS